MNNADKPAAPINGWSDDPIYQGLTKREHFAGLAMQGILGCQNITERMVSDNLGVIKADEVGEAAVSMADALLKALEAGDE